MDAPGGLGLAWGHVRNAAADLLVGDDPSGESLFLAAECLELEALFAELGVSPEPAGPAFGVGDSLDRAASALESIQPVVPLALWAALQALRTRAAR